MTPSAPRVPRFHLPGGLAPDTRFDLPTDAAHHASRVLRLREGDAVTVFGGEGGEFPARIETMSRDGVAIRTGAFHPIDKESPLAVTLVQGISGGDRMDLTIQKAVELGVAAIQPILAERSIVRLKGDRSDSRREHWARVAVAACEQCGRNRVPVVAPAIALEHLKPPEGATKLLLSPEGTLSLRALKMEMDKPVLLAAGPEAGFSLKEEAILVRAGFIPVRLGPRILRTETAAPAALAALNALYGDG